VASPTPSDFSFIFLEKFVGRITWAEIAFEHCALLAVVARSLGANHFGADAVCLISDTLEDNF
jgi:hypothetical protein